jgi:hypothetical protein
MRTTATTGTRTWMANRRGEHGVQFAGLGYAAVRMSMEEVAWQAGQNVAALSGGFLADQVYAANWLLGGLALVWAVVNRSVRPDGSGSFPLAAMRDGTPSETLGS